MQWDYKTIKYAVCLCCLCAAHLVLIGYKTCLADPILQAFNKKAWLIASYRL